MPEKKKFKDTGVGKFLLEKIPLKPFPPYSILLFLIEMKYRFRVRAKYSTND